MTDFLAADIKIEEQPPSAQVLPSLATAVAGMLGVVKQGPFGKTLCTSWPEWRKKFGDFLATSDAALAAFAFFKNGGKFLYTCRVVHYTDLTDPSTKTSTSATRTVPTTAAATQGAVTSGNVEPFALEAGDTCVLSVDRAGDETATFDAAAGSRTGSSGTFPTGFTGGETLTLKVDRGVLQTVIFTSAEQTALQVAAKINASIWGGSSDVDGGEVRVFSDRKGTGSYVEIVGGTGRTTIGLSIGETQGTGDVADIRAVTAAEIKSIVEADTTALVVENGDGTFTIKTPTVGATGYIQVKSSSTIDDAAKCDLDNSEHQGTAAGPGNCFTADALYDGTYANSLSVQIADATSGIATEFNMRILESGSVKESFINLTMTTTAPRYLETIVNGRTGGSAYVVVSDLHAGTPPANRPTNGSYALSGGGDGLTSIVDNDFIGDETGPTGLYQLDAAEDLTLLLLPGKATPAIHQAMVEYSEDQRGGQVFPILDPPAGYTAEEMRDYVLTTAALYELSEFGAIYWPRLRVQNPSSAVYTSDADGLIVCPPSGHVAGVIARTDNASAGGIHKAPAGVERGVIDWCLGLETEEVLDQRKRDIVYPANINPITKWTGVPIHIDGNRCLKTSGNWGYVSERRGMSYIERGIKLLLAFVRHANNDSSLRRRAYRTLDKFLRAEMLVGAFRTQDPSTAYWIDFSDALNPPEVVKSHKLIGRVGVAKAKSIDWAIIEISEDTAGADAAETA